MYIFIMLLSGPFIPVTQHTRGASQIEAPLVVVIGSKDMLFSSIIAANSNILCKFAN
jgi:hypothetical protein